MHRIGEPGRSDRFFDGTSLVDVVALHSFDMRLRTAVFSALTPIELAIRSLLGHELGGVSPTAHLEPDVLGPLAHRRHGEHPSDEYNAWRSKFTSELDRSREGFVEHHRTKYGGTLPIWAAIEVLSWGQMTQLFRMAPPRARSTIAEHVALTPPQLESWLKSLNILRNISAHHGRLFNRDFALTPKLPRDPSHDVTRTATSMNRVFGQLTLVQYLSQRLGVGNLSLLPAVLATFPRIGRVPLAATGAPPDWREHPQWSH